MDVKFWKEFAEKWNDEVVKPIQNRSEEKMNSENFKDYRGYCIKNHTNIHVCGYENNRILFQVMHQNDDKMRKARLQESTKGVFFTLKNKRIYIA